MNNKILKIIKFNNYNNIYKINKLILKIIKYNNYNNTYKIVIFKTRNNLMNNQKSKIIKFNYYNNIYKILTNKKIINNKLI